MPFEDDIQDEDVVVKNNKTSSINAASVKSKKTLKEEFEKKANEANDKMNDYNDRAAQLTSSFKKVLEDKTLLQNKNVFSLDLEKEVISNLAKLAIDMNTDENEIEGIGSVGIITLLLRACLIQRDRINTIEYNQSLLNNKIKELESSLNKKDNG